MISARTFHLSKGTIQLLRFPFSLYLAPVFLFALSQAHFIHWPQALLIFFIMHVLVYPSSNGFNSYMDRDSTSIGGLEKPPMPTSELFTITLFMDIAAIIMSLLIHIEVAFLVALYILASRAYSDRRTRLKKHAWTGFAVVSVFQGGVTFLIVFLSVNQFSLVETTNIHVGLSMMISSLIIGASYPMTQIYQHDADKQNRDITLSIKLGYTGTFIFSAVFFVTALVLLFIYFRLLENTWMFYLFVIFTLPVLSFFGWWFLQVLKDHRQANFKNTMLMNTISATSMALYFITLTIYKFF
jgi:4-hydroxybenzoate polyprenyltransferase